MLAALAPILPAGLAVTSYQLAVTAGSSEWPPIIAAVASIMASAAVLYGQWITRKEISVVHSVTKDVQNQVTTMNGLSMANLADNAEKRRSEGIPAELRTVDEQVHADAPISTGPTAVPGAPSTS